MIYEINALSSGRRKLQCILEILYKRTVKLSLCSMNSISLEKCKYDQTMIYCTLVEDALMRDDQKRVQELRASARRKRRVNQIKVEEIIEHYSEKAEAE